MKAFLLAAAAVLVLALAGSASADFNTGYYTHNGCPGVNTNRVDPINFVFYDWGTWDRAVSQIYTHAGWTDKGGSTQYFVDHSTNCNAMIAQEANAAVYNTRFHIRLHPIHSDPIIGWTTTADAHHEDFSLCGHSVDQNGSNGSGFDQGRRQLRILFENAGHTWYSQYWGNTQSFKQCDGGYASSDGYTVFMHLHQINH